MTRLPTTDWWRPEIGDRVRWRRSGLSSRVVSLRSERGVPGAVVQEHPILTEVQWVPLSAIEPDPLDPRPENAVTPEAKERVWEFLRAQEQNGSHDLIASEMYHGGMGAECAVLYRSDLIELLISQPENIS